MRRQTLVKGGYWLFGATVAALLEAIFAPLVKGEELKGLTGMAKLWHGFLVGVPLWLVLIIVAIAVAKTLMDRNLRLAAETENQRLLQDAGIVQAQIENIRRDHASEIEALKSKEPKLHGVWIPTQHIGLLAAMAVNPLLKSSAGLT
jgi:hypothetical protein